MRAPRPSKPWTLALADIAPRAHADLGWASNQENYVAGGEFQYPRGIAFYPWLPVSFKPDELYLHSNPKYSEFIQATVATPIYIVGVEIGFSNGGGSVVAIRVKTPYDTWVPLYTGEVDRDGAAEQRKYSMWLSPRMPSLGVLLHAHASAPLLRALLDVVA